MSAFYIAAAHKSSGKTTLSIGLTAALRELGQDIQTFKKGPDYIDPQWLSRASGHACHNLDFFTSSETYIREQFARQSGGRDVVLVEGNMGLFDGISLDGSDSNAAMAKLLDLPVVLIVDCSGTSRGIAPLLVGYRQFDPDLRYAGVVLNKLAGQRHESKLREMVETYTDFTVLGAVHRSDRLQLTERHLGLIPSNEVDSQAENLIAEFAGQIRDSIDLERILELPPSPLQASPDQAAGKITQPGPGRLRVAVAMDEAFGFYYPGDLQRFGELGVEIVPFRATHDHALPEPIDGMFIGGGFPESLAASLAANDSMRGSIRRAIENGLPAYAECGGLMYLCRSLETHDGVHPMCGLIEADVKMNRRPQGRGYVVLSPTGQHPWPGQGVRQVRIQAHEFHYSSLHGLPADSRFAYSMERGTGIDGVNDGIILRNLLASYTHLRSTDRYSWVDDFVSFIESHKSSIQS